MGREKGEDDAEPVQFLCRGGETSEFNKSFSRVAGQPAVAFPAIEAVGGSLWN